MTVAAAGTSLGAPRLARGLSTTYHPGSQVWVPVVEAAAGSQLTNGAAKKKVAHWRRGVVEAVHKQPDGEPLLDVRTEEGQQVDGLPASDCFLQNERDDTVDDLVKSDFLHEPGILHTLRVRYSLDSIYTYSGHILIAANPHKRLRTLYGPRMMAQYRGVPLGELSPHVYAIAEQAYAAMMMDEQRQAILISGESGAGKTESAKLVMQYLAHRAMPAHAAHAHLIGSASLARTASTSGAAPAPAGPTNGVESAPIEEQVLESNPLLEAFGNAKTSRNDNSSRFGKFVEIDFDAGGRVTGASISTYLLERSRVVSIKPPERSYHIFYQLCAGASEDQTASLGLAGGARSFRYLTQSDVFELADVDDAREFRHTLEAMRIVGLQQHHVDAVLRTVAGVLHLGNVGFANNASDEAVLDGPASTTALDTAARVLGVSEVGLEAALTTRAIDARGERIVMRLDAAAAAESRDALAKTLYARLFDWLVAAINKKIGSLGSGAQRAGGSARRIGILDIYGFESFEINSFEQLCINLANERLQQQFNAHVFKGEQEEYAREGIAWSYIDFVDNQDCLDLLEGGVFPLIDEACRLPRATHQDLAHTLRSRLAATPRFSAPRRAPHAFAVDHYAGEVVYSSEQLMDKNKDFVVAEHAHLLGSSELTITRELFAPDAAAAAAGGAAADSIAAAAGSELPSPRRADPKARKSAFMLSSVGARFRKQLAGLMGTLSQCQPHYIRCVKPNPDSQPGNLAPAYVLEQLRAGGVLEAVRIACAGFPTRKPFQQFAQRYTLLLPEGALDAASLGARRPGSSASAGRPGSSASGGGGGTLPITSSGFIDWFAVEEAQVADLARRILFASQLEGWQLGRSRVFLRAGQLAQLEGARGRRLSAAAVRIQAAWRGMEARQTLRRARAAALAIQSAWRGHTARAAAQRRRSERAAVRVQAAWRMHRARSAFQLHRRTRAATTIQSYVRMQQQQRRFLRDTELGKKQAARAAEEAQRAAAAITIQAAVRRRMAQKQAARLCREAAKLRELQQQRDQLVGDKERLGQALAAALARADRAEAEAASLKAQVASLSSELEASQLQLRAATSAAAEALDATASAATAAQAAAAAELEAAHRRAAAALQAEIDLLRQQRAAADAAQQQLEGELSSLQQQVRAQREELEAATAAAEAKEAERAALVEQAQAAAEQHARELAAREEAAAAAQAQAAAAAQGAYDEAEAARQQMAAQLAELQIALEEQRRVATAAQAGQQAAVEEAKDKGAHLAARVAALSAHAQRLESDLHAATAREQQLQEEVAAAKRAATALQRSPSKISALPATPSRTLSEQFEGAGIPAVPAPASLSLQRAAAVASLRAAAVERHLQVVSVQLGGGAALSIPLASWLLCESLIQWAGSWQLAEIDMAAEGLQRAIVDAADGGGLHGQSYWLACSLAAGGLLKFRTIGRRDVGHLSRLGDALIRFQAVHEPLGDSIAGQLPVNVAVLLSEDAKRTARRRGHTPQQHMPGVDGSPARDGTQSPWQSLLGGVSNVLASLRSEGVPAPTVRALAWGCLRYIDAELLNALLLRRDCCSLSAAKALQAGLAELRAWVAYAADEGCCGDEEAEGAIERISQAARYLVQGKEDCVRKAYRGVDIYADLQRMCPALSLQQVYKLTEHQHDDWIVAASSGRESLALLETLQRLMTAQRERALEDGELLRDDDLLEDPREAFLLPQKALVEGARCFVQPPSIGVTVGGATPQRPAAQQPGTPATPGMTSPLRLPPGPRLPNGSLPAAAASPAGPAPGTLSQNALLDRIASACLAAGLPGELAGQPEFGFLAGAEG
ncbi:Myosin-J heavy chain isoform A [Micractinium conductrix]|uniref:Myosin-J heavy chain isoform A n=1 Tax=Micractinium conductrix TaxID=554055 RepID=A0A2P6VLL3_9CHLO|nr:Myosin-J heavy chain isoform B [Micractinium conductrix]PSC74955.1 Myosin-J heavy chain isoform A [Micractinium conductrix]|eukprot:PSC74954.1 Myosin-J heavy chain isoform B [Micractinium conductrix]